MSARELLLRLAKGAGSFTKPETATKQIRCSFCGLGRDDVKAMVSGPSVYICDECVRVSAALMAAAQTSSNHTPVQEH